MHILLRCFHKSSHDATKIYLPDGFAMKPLKFYDLLYAFYQSIDETGSRFKFFFFNTINKNWWKKRVWRMFADYISIVVSFQDYTYRSLMAVIKCDELNDILKVHLTEIVSHFCSLSRGWLIGMWRRLKCAVFFSKFFNSSYERFLVLVCFLDFLRFVQNCCCKI